MLTAEWHSKMQDAYGQMGLAVSPLWICNLEEPEFHHLLLMSGWRGQTLRATFGSKETKQKMDRGREGVAMSCTLLLCNCLSIPHDHLLIIGSGTRRKKKKNNPKIQQLL